jgi:hypothetical protein
MRNFPGRGPASRAEQPLLAPASHHEVVVAGLVQEECIHALNLLRHDQE